MHWWSFVKAVDPTVTVLLNLSPRYPGPLSNTDNKMIESLKYGSTITVIKNEENQYVLQFRCGRITYSTKQPSLHLTSKAFTARFQMMKELPEFYNLCKNLEYTEILKDIDSFIDTSILMMHNEIKQVEEKCNG